MARWRARQAARRPALSPSKQNVAEKIFPVPPFPELVPLADDPPFAIDEKPPYVTVEFPPFEPFEPPPPTTIVIILGVVLIILTFE